MTEETIDGGGSGLFELVIKDPEWVEHEDGTRTLVGGEVDRIQANFGNDDGEDQ